jgi:hypothetical protein
MHGEVEAKHQRALRAANFHSCGVQSSASGARFRFRFVGEGHTGFGTDAGVLRLSIAVDAHAHLCILRRIGGWRRGSRVINISKEGGVSAILPRN